MKVLVSAIAVILRQVMCACCTAANLQNFKKISTPVALVDVTDWSNWVLVRWPNWITDSFSVRPFL